MALRFAARKASSAPAFLTRSAAAARRQASSSSSSSPQFSPKSKSTKKVSDDRLASVIDAVNDRKLPPELRGQRNNVRCTFNSFRMILISRKVFCRSLHFCALLISRDLPLDNFSKFLEIFRLVIWNPNFGSILSDLCVFT